MSELSPTHVKKLLDNSTQGEWEYSRSTIKLKGWNKHSLEGEAAFLHEIEQDIIWGYNGAGFHEPVETRAEADLELMALAPQLARYYLNMNGEQ